MNDLRQPDRSAPGEGPSLCRPAPGLSCFRCCPPIRPAGYDHLDHRPELLRQLVENTEDFRAGRLGREIVGFSCWGLGLVDPGRGLVGCLLHPAQNNEDLRDLTGYGEKCRRETCLQNTIFAELEEPARQALISPLLGLDSFRFSSPGANPVWNLLLWGPEVLNILGPGLAPGAPLREYLAEHPEPRSRALLLSGLLERLSPADRVALAQEPSFGPWFEDRTRKIRAELESGLPPQPPQAPLVHLLGLERTRAWFIRFGLGRRRMEGSVAQGLDRAMEKALDRLAGAWMGRERD